jgi:hypothetical protein
VCEFLRVSLDKGLVPAGTGPPDERTQVPPA